MMKLSLAVFGMLFSVVVLVGCSPVNYSIDTESSHMWGERERLTAMAGTDGDWRGATGRNDNATAFEASPPAKITTSYAAPEPQPAAASVARRVIYTGGLTILSPDPDGAITAAQKIAENTGGYVASVRGQRIVLRVPAAKFDATMSVLAELGLVTDRQIDAADVTEQMIDLEIRLDNLEVLRKRMQALLEKADKVEDALKIEQELGRLTGEIESIKGNLRLLSDRITLSTITVTFNTPAGTASGLATRVRPFQWVNGVGAEAFGAARLPRAQAKLGKAPKLDLPDGFVRFYQQNYNVYAIDRGQVVVKVTRQTNYDDAEPAFWANQVRSRLTEDLGVPVSEPIELRVGDDRPTFTMSGQRPAGQDQLGYFVGLAASNKYVYLIEAWGPAEEVENQQSALIDSLESLRVTRGWF